MNEGSYKYMIAKIERKLSEIFLKIDPNDEKFITFGQLGRIMNFLNIFRIIKYDVNFERSFLKGI